MTRSTHGREINHHPRLHTEPARGRWRKCCLFVASLALATHMGGCWSYRQGEYQGDRPAPISKVDGESWPTRDENAVKELLAKTPDSITLRTIRPEHEQEAPAELKEQLKNEQLVITYKGIHGRGLLRIVDRQPAPGATGVNKLEEILDFLTTGFTPNAYWLTSRTLEGIEEFRRRRELFEDPERSAIGIALPLDTDLKNNPPIEPNPLLETLHLQQGMSIRFPPAAQKDKPYIGVVLHLNAMFGNEYEVRTLEEFTRRGWAVIDLKPTSQVSSPMPQEWQERCKALSREQTRMMAEICESIGGAQLLFPKDSEEFAQWSAQYANHPLLRRMQEHGKLLAAMNRGAFIARGPADAPGVGKALAQEIDQAQAGSAYAAEAVLEYIDQNREDLRGIPVVVIGFSGGALTTPTVAARVLDRISAVVIIGGAADCFTASQLSTFSSGGLYIRTTTDDVLEPRKPSDELLAAISREYLAASKLDPYHTAPLLQHTPVLFVAGTSDTWVPSSCGELLYERLGRPDRLTISAGHELLFFFLPSKASFIADWVAAHALK